MGEGAGDAGGGNDVVSQRQIQLERQRLCMARLRAERHGEPPNGFPCRVRAKGGGRKPLTKLRRLSADRQNRLKEGGLVCYFDDIGGPVHGDALERLALI